MTYLLLLTFQENVLLRKDLESKDEDKPKGEFLSTVYFSSKKKNNHIYYHHHRCYLLKGKVIFVIQKLVCTCFFKGCPIYQRCNSLWNVCKVAYIGTFVYPVISQLSFRTMKMSSNFQESLSTLSFSIVNLFNSTVWYVLTNQVIVLAFYTDSLQASQAFLSCLGEECMTSPK